jgi:hypothetical protein
MMHNLSLLLFFLFWHHPDPENGDEFLSMERRVMCFFRPSTRR